MKKVFEPVTHTVKDFTKLVTKTTEAVKSFGDMVLKATVDTIGVILDNQTIALLSKICSSEVATEFRVRHNVKKTNEFLVINEVPIAIRRFSLSFITSKIKFEAKTMF